MAAIGKKRTADMATESGTAKGSNRHPCFWSVLHGESLNFVFVSASLHSFLGPDKASTMLNQSLFDYIHPDEATRARSDLVDTFISKSFVGSNIRCRLRRFDLDKVGFQQLFRRASESHIPHQSHPARHVHESLERKLSLPIIPDIAKLRSTRECQQQQQQPVPKRLKTILEDSIGTMSPADTCATTGAEDSDSDEYLIANIALYLVSKKLSIMVCHYENTPARGLLPTSTQGSSKATSAGSSLSSSLSPTIQCDCISNASMMADAERVQHLLSQIHKLDIIDTPQGLSRGMSGGGNSILGSVGSSLASRHAQIYSIDTERLLCAFPEEGYTKVFGKSPFDATKEGVNLRSLWKVGSEGRVEGDVLGLLQCPCVPSSDPIRLELQIKNSSTGALAGVQTILFRWGHLLFVCQQVRSENSPDASSISTVGGDDNILSRYNLSTPPGDDATRNDASDHGARHDPGSHGYAGNRSTARLRTTRSAVVLQSNSPMLPLSQRTALGQQQQQQPGPLVETRPFSIPRAPASVAASLPPRPAFALTPPESVPPRRQSSYTLPPAKSFEERRFSYPIQALNGERRQPPAPSLLANSHGVAASGAAAGAAGIRGSPASLSSPGSRVLELRQRVGAAGGGGNLQMGSGGAAVPKGGEASNQPTPAVSPLASSTHHHTPVSLSPAPQPPSANQGGYVQVNLYPPPHETGESWRWPQAPHILAQPQMQPHHSQQQQQHQHQQHQLLAFNMSPNQRPPIRNPNSPHPHLLLNAVHDQYQSPVASAVASPSMAGPIVHRIEPEKKTCKSCGTDSSPEWRKGPTGHKTLCNACGLRYARSINRANKKMAG